jgi:uncharacterized protein (DUF2147 family)
MNRVLPLLAGLALSATLTGSAAASEASGLYGVWRNPKNSVHVDIEPCGKAACGEVVWATPKAQADAQKGSGKPLVGQRLLRDMTPTKTGEWRGKVFVPDLNMTFAGTAQLLDGGRMTARGCLLGGVFCKTQVWSKLSGPAD